MQVRFVCPACEHTHVADVPETTIHMTCATAHRVIRVRLTAGGDVKAAVVGQDQDAAESGGDEE
jgi:hypothetical protein